MRNRSDRIIPKQAIAIAEIRNEDKNTPKTTMSEKITSFYQPQRMIRIKIMLEWLGCSRTTLYRWVQDGKFPQPKKMNGGRTLGWTYSQYEQWLTEH